jgi:hypothetical protein
MRCLSADVQLPCDVKTSWTTTSWHQCAHTCTSHCHNAVTGQQDVGGQRCHTCCKRAPAYSTRREKTDRKAPLQARAHCRMPPSLRVRRPANADQFA